MQGCCMHSTFNFLTDAKDPVVFSSALGAAGQQRWEASWVCCRQEEGTDQDPLASFHAWQQGSSFKVSSLRLGKFRADTKTHKMGLDG